MSDEPIFDRKPAETDAQYIMRIFLDPWFEDATPAEIADFTGLKPSYVGRVIHSWVKSSKVRRIHSHATAVAEQMGWAGTPEGLIHTALELMKQRAEVRESPVFASHNIDDQIRDFLMEHRVKSDEKMPPRRPPKPVLPPDTEPGNV